MLPIQDTCQPRPDTLQGSFNPEIFTASLSPVLEHYRGKAAATHALYTDAEAFFRDATYPTEGLRMLPTDVFSRLAGDHSAPALQRLLFRLRDSICSRSTGAMAGCKRLYIDETARGRDRKGFQ
jgi:hypothetical protein